MDAANPEIEDVSFPESKLSEKTAPLQARIFTSVFQVFYLEEHGAALTFMDTLNFLGHVASAALIGCFLLIRDMVAYMRGPIICITVLYFAVIYGQKAFTQAVTHAYEQAISSTTSVVCDWPLMPSLLPLCNGLESSNSVVSIAGTDIVPDIVSLFEIQNQVAYQAALQESPSLLLVEYVSEVARAFEDLGLELYFADDFGRGSVLHTAVKTVGVNARRVSSDLFRYSILSMAFLNSTVRTTDQIIEEIHDPYFAKRIAEFFYLTPPRVDFLRWLYKQTVEEMEENINKLVQLAQALSDGLRVLHMSLDLAKALSDEERHRLVEAMKSSVKWREWVSFLVGGDVDKGLSPNQLENFLESLRQKVKAGLEFIIQAGEHLDEQRTCLEYTLQGTTSAESEALFDVEQFKTKTLQNRERLSLYKSTRPVVGKHIRDGLRK